MRKLFIFETCDLALIQIRYGKMNHRSLFNNYIASKRKVGINSLLITENDFKKNWRIDEGALIEYLRNWLNFDFTKNWHKATYTKKIFLAKEHMLALCIN